MKLPDPPAAMRERLLQDLLKRVYDANPAGLSADWIRATTFGFQQGWQAAHPSSEKIEEVARRIADRVIGNYDEFERFNKEVRTAKVAAILREALGGE